ncbi:MAG: ABC transporter ATP-binding protein [Clostridia bacterium]|nr:ABC transporter ATP-binding protein [Clostridia bacterium]
MEPIITVEHVTMNFRINVSRTNSLKEYFVAKLKGRLRYENFQALRDVTFSVQQGEILGILGRNGAGKSTLLKVISGIYRPTSGSVVTRGRIAPMLELGSGFDYELSGRDNIFLNGAILGFDEKFLHDRYDEIVEFSELGEFIDQPIKTYSSGMVMRLAFAVATLVSPEILIVDEILSVGDAAFQKKSYARMMEMMSSGTTVLMVSHNIDQIRSMCQRAIWLDHGSLRMSGEVAPVCDAYTQWLEAGGA